MATRDEVLQADISTLKFGGGPAVLFIQAAANFDISGYSATGFPVEIGDIINLATLTGTPKTANGWRGIGMTAGIRPGRSRTTVQVDSDQLAPVLTLHDRWAGEIVFTFLETYRVENMLDFLVGDPAGVTAVTTPGSGVAQSQLGFGSPSNITYRRMAIMHPTPRGAIWCWVFAMTTPYVTQAANFERTGRHEWQVTAQVYADTRIASVQHRVMRLYFTADSYLTG